MELLSGRSRLGRTTLCLAAVAYPVAIGTIIYLSLGRGWDWYESIPVGLGVLWAPSLAWVGCAIAGRGD